VGKALTDKGFATKNFAPADDGTNTYTEYTSTDTSCGVAIRAESPTGSLRIVEIACYDASGYQKLAATLKPFADAYMAANKESSSTESTLLMTGNPSVAASKTNGYRTAQIMTSGHIEGKLVVGGYLSQFYQTPDGVWHFFVNMQNRLTCDQYNSIDVKKAYFGERCYDITTNNEQATVSL
jgi:hypothetical protein